MNEKVIALHGALPQFDIAEMYGDANFTLRGESLPHLTKSMHLDGEFLVTKGILNTIDMVEATQMPTSNGVSGGRTHLTN